jgi:hypothetical protein
MSASCLRHFFLKKKDKKNKKSTQSINIFVYHMSIMTLTRAMSALLASALGIWMAAVRRHGVAAARIQRWWQRFPKPTNSTDPITLEDIPRGAGKSTEDGGKWFDLYVGSTILYRYAADSLFSYMVSQCRAVEPHIRHKLNKVELTRLNAATSTDIKRSLQCSDVTRLLLPEAEESRRARMEQESLLFFLEDDFMTVCDRLTESCHQYATGTSDFAASLLTDFVNIFADICHMDLTRADYHLTNTVQGIRRTIFQLLPTLKTDVFCDIILTLDRPSQIYNLHRFMQQYSNNNGLELQEETGSLLLQASVSSPSIESPQSPSILRPVPLSARIVYGSVDDGIELDEVVNEMLHAGALTPESSSRTILLSDSTDPAARGTGSSLLFIQ